MTGSKIMYPHAFPYGMGKYRRIDAGNRSEWLNVHESTTLDLGVISICSGILFVVYCK